MNSHDAALLDVTPAYEDLSYEYAVAKAIALGLRTGDIFNPADPAARRVGTREMGDTIANALAL